jgi:hypothetical protein
MLEVSYGRTLHASASLPVGRHPNLMDIKDLLRFFPTFIMPVETRFISFQQLILTVECEF